MCAVWAEESERERARARERERERVDTLGLQVSRRRVNDGPGYVYRERKQERGREAGRASERTASEGERKKEPHREEIM